MCNVEQINFFTRGWYKTDAFDIADLSMVRSVHVIIGLSINGPKDLRVTDLTESQSHNVCITSHALSPIGNLLSFLSSVMCMPTTRFLQNGSISACH